MPQEIIWGAEALKDITAGKRVLLVSSGLKRYPAIKKALEAADCVPFSGFTPNPLYEQVCAGVELFRRENCELIVAVGGGSAIDTAKCIKLFCRMEGEGNYLSREWTDTGVPLVAVPTTAGTGSESTRHAVIYLDGVKQSVSHPSIVPDQAVLVPETLAGLPDYQKKSTMLDALCQAIESWWSVNSTEESVAYSLRAVGLIRRRWEDYIERGDPLAARDIMEAANLAGRAINITATTAAHAMSYKLTSLYGLAHGHAVALCMPHVWEYIAAHTDECADSRGRAHLERTMADIAACADLGWYKELLARLALPRPKAAEREEELTLLAGSVNALRLKNNPVALSRETIRAMYERIVD